MEIQIQLIVTVVYTSLIHDQRLINQKNVPNRFQINIITFGAHVCRSTPDNDSSDQIKQSNNSDRDSNHIIKTPIVKIQSHYSNYTTMHKGKFKFHKLQT
jgi:hypothetical protein